MAEKVYLRCSTLSSMERPNPAPNSPGIGTKMFGKVQDWLDQRPVLAHWQLECHGMIFEIKRFGSRLNPQLEFKPPCPIATDRRLVFYREEIGTTSMSAEDVYNAGLESVHTGTYSRLWRNCQTLTKHLADRIVLKNDRDANFSWPWRSSHVAMIVLAGIAGGVTVWYLAPLLSTAPVYLTARGAKNVASCHIDWSLGWKIVVAGTRHVLTGGKTYLDFILSETHIIRMRIDMAMFRQFAQLKLLPTFINALKAGGIALFHLALANLPQAPEWLHNLWASLWAKKMTDEHRSQLMEAFREMMDKSVGTMSFPHALVAA